MLIAFEYENLTGKVNLIKVFLVGRIILKRTLKKWD
jgi:hypothetical protein